MKYLIVIACLFSGGLGFAQTNFAIKGGPNTSTALVSVNGANQQANFINGFNAGVQLETFFDHQLYFTPSIMYSSRGFGYTGIADTAYKYKLGYIDINPTLVFYLNKKHKENGFAILAGPYISVAANGKNTTTTNNSSTSQSLAFNFVSGISLVDLGVNGGFRWKIHRLYLEALYQHGFANINNDYAIDGKNYQNRMICFNIGYFLTNYK